MELIKIIFEVVGSELISAIIGAIISGGICYKIGVSKNQKAGKNSKQIQNSVNINGIVTAQENMKIGCVSNEERK